PQQPTAGEGRPSTPAGQPAGQSARQPTSGPAALSDSARDHLWMHFTRMSAYRDSPVPVIARGEGPYVWDTGGKRYLGALSGLFVDHVGHGRSALAEAGSNKAAELAYLPP